MNVPLLDLKEQNKAIDTELKQAFEDILYSGNYILGKAVSDMEAQMASFLQTPHALGVSSGTDAIILALMTLEIGDGDEVLCPSFTFFATAGCIHRVGATPVFVDIDPISYNIDPKDAASKITDKTKAIIPVHLYGQCADMDAIMGLAKEHNLHVIEDTAQSFGAQYKGTYAGTIGTFGTYSFFPTKNFGCLGDGGMLSMNDPALADKALSFRNHGAKQRYYHDFVGGNFRLDALQAAFLSIKLKHADSYQAKRTHNAEHYIAGLLKSERIAVASKESLNSDALILLPATLREQVHCWNQFTLRVRSGKRDALKTFLAEKNISSQIYYPLPLHQQKCFKYTNPTGNLCLPVTEQTALECISIPVYPELSKEQLDYTIEQILNFVSSY